MTTKSNAEFIAECEAAIANDGKIGTWNGVPIIMRGGTYDLLKEAIERLRAADEKLHLKSIMVAGSYDTYQFSPADIANLAAHGAKDREIAELKAKLKAEEMKYKDLLSKTIRIPPANEGTVGGIDRRYLEAEKLETKLDPSIPDPPAIELRMKVLKLEHQIRNENQELKELLRWLHDKMKADTWDFDDDVHNAWDHQVDCPEKQRIDQILQTHTPKEGDSDG